jgi:hypothetical protein
MKPSRPSALASWTTYPPSSSSGQQPALSTAITDPDDARSAISVAESARS